MRTPTRPTSLPLPLLATVSAARPVALETREFPGHLDSVQGRAFSTEGMSLLSGGWDGRILIHDLRP